MLVSIIDMKIKGLALQDAANALIDVSYNKQIKWD